MGSQSGNPDNLLTEMITFSREKEDIEKSTGIFSFSFYKRDDGQFYLHSRLFIYILGLYAYEQVCKIMKGWHCVIYTDNATITNMKRIIDDIQQNKRHMKETKKIASDLLTIESPDRCIAILLWDTILSSPNVTIAIVEWPEYSLEKNKNSVEDTILRVMRFRAFTEFSKIPVFVRDADTLFPEKLINFNADKYKRPFNEIFPVWLAAWEEALLLNQKKSGKPFLIGSSLRYFKKWHKNRFTQVSSLGVYAGLVNSLGDIPDFVSGKLWNETIQYIRKGNEIIRNPSSSNNSPSSSNNSPFIISNQETNYYIGKDEQILLYIHLPTLFNSTYFFYFDLDDLVEIGHFENNTKYAEFEKDFYNKRKTNKSHLSIVLHPFTVDLNFQQNDSGNYKYHEILKETLEKDLQLYMNVKQMQEKTIKEENQKTVLNRIRSHKHRIEIQSEKELTTFENISSAINNPEYFKSQYINSKKSQNAGGRKTRRKKRKNTLQKPFAMHKT